MTCEICDSGTITHRYVRARKDYLCCECNRPIPKKTMYWSFEGCWDSWQRFKTCTRCENLRNQAILKYGSAWLEENPAFGELFEWIRESRR